MIPKNWNPFDFIATENGDQISTPVVEPAQAVNPNQDSLLSGGEGIPPMQIQKSTAKSKGRKPKDCKTYIFAKKAQGKSRKRFVKRGSQSHTGDYTIPYMSLSYAHAWLTEPTAEHRPAVEHKPKKYWTPSAVGMGVTTDPAVNLYASSPNQKGETTVVIEVEGVDHLEIIKHSYVHSLVFEHLMPLISKELFLASPDQYKYKE